MLACSYQWFFGLNAHIGVDSKEGIVHSVCSTAASDSDVRMMPELLHGDEKKVTPETEVIDEVAPGSVGYDFATRENERGQRAGVLRFFRAAPESGNRIRDETTAGLQSLQHPGYLTIGIP